MINKTTYQLPEENYYKDIFDKTQIIIGHTYRNNMKHYGSWVYRLNGKNKKTATFTITKEGKIFQHYDPKYYSDFTNNNQDKASISIVLENLGWLKKDGIINLYVDWLGNTHRKEEDEILSKRWRNHNYWDKYSQEQLSALKIIINKLCEEYNIPKNFIGHNVYDENVDLYKGITFRSNYSQESTDVSPAFDMELLKNL